MDRRSQKMETKNISLTDVHSLEQLRDELAIQAALFKADVKTEWEEVEHKWHQLSSQLNPLVRAAEKSAVEVTAASQLLFQSVKEGYERIKKTLH